MSTTPTGPLGGPLQAMKEMVCGSASFQTWVGAEDATEAAERVFFHNVSGEDEVFPMVFLSYNDGHHFQSSDSGSNFRHQHELFLLAEDLVADADDEAEALLKFVNTFGPVLSEILAQSGMGGRVKVLEGERLLLSVGHGAEANAPHAVSGQPTRKRRVQAAYSVIVGVR